jgi:hypothetical protein
MEKDLNLDEPVQHDAIDQLIIDELGHQEQLRRKMKEWDCRMALETPSRLSSNDRQRLLRRHRLVPIISNILSIAALMVVGLILQALVPGFGLTSQATSDQLLPAVEKTINSSPSAPAAGSILPDTAAVEP